MAWSGIGLHNPIAIIIIAKADATDRHSRTPMSSDERLGSTKCMNASFTAYAPT